MISTLKHYESDSKTWPPKFAVYFEPVAPEEATGKYGPALRLAKLKPPVLVAGFWLAIMSLFQPFALTLNHISLRSKLTAAGTILPVVHAPIVVMRPAFIRMRPSLTQPMPLRSPPTKAGVAGRHGLPDSPRRGWMRRGLS